MQPLVFLLLVAVINVGVCQECAPDWLPFQGHCYGYGEKAVSWGNAQAICQSHGGTLAKIPTFAVNNFLSLIVRHKGDICVWFGGSDIFHEGDWKWSSGRNDFYSFTNWNSGEPNDWDNDQDCLNMNGASNYNWDDMDCNYNCNFICEAPASDRG